MSYTYDIPVCILAGGSSRRFGSPKGLTMLGGQRLIDIVIQKMVSQTSAKVLLNGDVDGPYASGDVQIIPDRIEGSLGPLAGIHAAMAWAKEQGFDSIVTSGLDLPFLPKNMIAVLSAQGGPAVCASLGQWHPVIGLWPCTLLRELEKFMEAGGRSVHAWAEHCQAKIADFPLDAMGRDPFWNINTKTDLEQAVQGTAR